MLTTLQTKPLTYLRKPKIIQAVQFNGFNIHDLKKIAGNWIFVNVCEGYEIGKGLPKTEVYLLTNTGKTQINPGDYLIKEDGFFSIHPGNEFEREYELYEDPWMREHKNKKV